MLASPPIEGGLRRKYFFIMTYRSALPKVWPSSLNWKEAAVSVAPDNFNQSVMGNFSFEWYLGDGGGSAYYSNAIFADFNDLAVFLLGVSVDHRLVLVFVD